MSVLVAAILGIGFARSSSAAQPDPADVDSSTMRADTGSPDGGLETPLAGHDLGLRWGVGAGGMLVRADTWDYAMLAQVRAFVPRGSWDLGGSLTLYLAVDPSSFAEGAALDAEATNWVTAVYGWGVGAGLGLVNFTGRHPDAVWVGQAVSAQALLKPVALRFGPVEPALNLGAVEYFGWDWKPWAFVSCTLNL